MRLDMIENNESWYQYKNELVKLSLEQASTQDDAKFILATHLEDWITDLFDTFFNPEPGEAFNRDIALMFSDTGSLWRVDWREVAENFLEG